MGGWLQADMFQAKHGGSVFVDWCLPKPVSFDTFFSRMLVCSSCFAFASSAMQGIALPLGAQDI